MASYQYDLFVSYAHNNNRRETWVNEFTEAIKDEHLQQTGKPLSVFTDTILLAGERWDERILGAVKASRCLLAVMSPSYFQSSYCRKEWEHFRAVEKLRGIHDLIIPAYYITYDLFETAGQQEDEWLKDLVQRQHEDFREYRHSGPQAFQNERPLRARVERLVKGLRMALQKAPADPPALEQ